MTALRVWFSRLRGVFAGASRDRGLSDEMAAHLDLLTEDHMRRGMTAAEARAAARRDFGGVDQVTERYRDQRGWPWLDGLIRDVRLALRGFRRSPMFFFVAVLTLALGIGANTAMFSLINGLLLRTLPVVEPERLVTITSGSDVLGNQWSLVTWGEIRRHEQLFAGAIAWSGAQFNLADSGEAQPVTGVYVSGNYFSVLGVPPQVGRVLAPSDDVRGGGADGPVAVISDGLWQRRFGRNPGVVGTRLDVEHVPFTIVGVAPPGFHGVEIGQAFDVAVPIAAEPLIRGRNSFSAPPLDRFNYWLRVMMRLKPGQSIDAATAAIRAAQPQIRQDSAPQGIPGVEAAFLKDPFVLFPAGGGADRIIGPAIGLRQRYSATLFVLLIVVALVLLIASANIANLLLARAAQRRHEMSVQLALGVGRWRLARRMLVESLMLAAAGAMVGMIFAVWFSRLLVAQLAVSVTRLFVDLSMDWRILGFTAGLTTLTAVLFGVVPALRASRIAPTEAMKQDERGSANTRGRLQGGLVVAQIGLSFVLVMAAGLFVGTFQRLATRPLGFDQDAVLIVGVDASRAAVAPGNRNAFFHQLVDVAAATPGVAHAGASQLTPLDLGVFAMSAEVPGRPPMSEPDRRTLTNFATPGWLPTYGIRILAGRDFDARDSTTSPQVALVSEAFVRHFFPNGEALGQAPIVRAGPGGSIALGSKTIVGIVSDAVYGSLRQDIAPVMYFPLTQWPTTFVPMTSAIRISVRPRAGSPASVAPSLATTLKAVDPNLAFTFRPLAEQVSMSWTQERLVAQLSGFFGALAMFLAAIGLYGVTSYTVSLRRTEMGIRLALGGAPRTVLGLVMSRVCLLLGLGLISGAVISIWIMRLAGSMLYGVTPRDPSTLIGSALVLTVVGVLAGWLPARRAARLDPAVTLRYE